MGQGTQQLRRKFSVELPFADFEKLVQIRNSGKYASYSDFFRTAIRNENVKEKKWKNYHKIEGVVCDGRRENI